MSLTVLAGLPPDTEPPDVYYTDAFAAIGAEIETDSAQQIVLAYEDNGGTIHMQCLLRPIGNGRFKDITTPYGYGGPMLTGNPNTGQFIRDLKEWAASELVVSAFVRFDPIQANHQAFPTHATFVSNVVLAPTSRDFDILANLSPRYRKQYRRALREGMKTEFAYDLTNENMGEFRQHYVQSMDRVQAKRNYYFSDGFWDAVVAKQKELGASISRTTLDGAVHATALRLSHGHYAYNFLSATSDIGRHSHATEFDKISFCLHSQQHGCDLVNFGGGVGGDNDSLLEHKKRFALNSPLGDFNIGKFIFLPDIYESLSGGPFSGTGPFPAYRFLDVPAG